MRIAASTPSGPRLIRRDTALAEGMSASDIRRARQRGALTAVARGVYLPAADAAELDGAGRHLAEVEAMVPRLVGEPVVSHVSAAVVHGLPFWHSEMPAVHVTRDRSAKARHGPHLQAHRAVLHDSEVVIVGGLRVTSVARTVIDCARTLPFENAVVLADAALHRGVVTRADLEAQVRRHARVPWGKLADGVVAFADLRSTSVGTSLSRVALHTAGLPAPQVDFDIVDGDGACRGRSDFGYPGPRVLGEFDGWEEFGRLLGPAADRDGAHRDSAHNRAHRDRVIAAERVRHRQLLAAGWRVVRWTWGDLARPAAMIGRMRQALELPEPVG